MGSVCLKEGKYNPVASLLLTTSEGAVKRLFSTQAENTAAGVSGMSGMSTQLGKSEHVP